eukprot:4901152-Prymnesium_polylepis.2
MQAHLPRHLVGDDDDVAAGPPQTPYAQTRSMREAHVYRVAEDSFRAIAATGEQQARLSPLKAAAARRRRGRGAAQPRRGRGRAHACAPDTQAPTAHPPPVAPPTR